MRERAHQPSSAFAGATTASVPAAVPRPAGADRFQLAVRDLSKDYGPRRVLDRVSFTVRPGERVAVVGENGSGKSTLVRLLVGLDTPDEGEITLRAPGGVAHLAQTSALAATATVRDAIDADLTELRALERDLRRAEETLADASADELSRYGELLETFAERGGYEADARVAAALDGLGIGGLDRERTLGTLSGGERSRLALAGTLCAGAELLLLDEPTNHLDADAVTWLRRRLVTHQETVVVVTHDRAFLREYATTILEVDADTRTVRRYGDGWDGYRAVRETERRRLAQEHREWREETARAEALVDMTGTRLTSTGKDPRQGFGKHRRSSEAKLSGRVRAARARLEHLRTHPVPPPPEPLRFTVALRTGSAKPLVDRSSTPADSPLPAPPVAAPPRVEVDGVVVGDRLQVPELRVPAGGRLLVSGPNGAGKSTLLRLLARVRRADKGDVRVRARVGYLPQEPAPLPAATGATLLCAYAAGRLGPSEEYAEELLAMGLFRAEDLLIPAAGLSAGQRRRIELARLVSRPTELLVLDEPTNHISPALTDEFQEALTRYSGAIVLVTHDQVLRDAFSGEYLHLLAGRPVAP
ncbi:ABC-F family ATP-binding cassette domain-containing protein [Streptomyces sp. Qhu-G9]|uniref:ABC-F family ATP-binding cassette domain-containing protein n=1 Tax=Streptomyces sp. Qhu-G9 TaxID=3452799 RepID=UPI0022AC82F8|nr:ABC-F family ATP-binding cassette domain-containing protein [Streptomyces aurantiacus]WAU81911.1 ABC-F family ATP-binding cassette domain-containing protein [Streptomyces aurantiacus]